MSFSPSLIDLPTNPLSGTCHLEFSSNLLSSSHKAEMKFSVLVMAVGGANTLNMQDFCKNGNVFESRNYVSQSNDLFDQS